MSVNLSIVEFKTIFYSTEKVESATNQVPTTIIGGASASVATVRSSKSRFAIDEYMVRAIHTGHARNLIFDGQRSSFKSKVECRARRLGGVLRKR